MTPLPDSCSQQPYQRSRTLTVVPIWYPLRTALGKTRHQTLPTPIPPHPTSSSDQSDNESSPGKKNLTHRPPDKKHTPTKPIKDTSNLEPSRESARATQRSPQTLGSPSKSRLPRMFCGTPESRARSVSPSTKTLSPKKKVSHFFSSNKKTDKVSHSFSFW